MTTNRYQMVLRAFGSSPWAILPEKLEAISMLLELRASGQFVSEEQVAEITAASRSRTAAAPGAVAVIPIYGVIAPRMNMMMYYSGGTSIDQLTADYRAAINNPDVTAIVFDVDSPGGQVQGVHELAQEILANRGKKKTVAVANGTMASAAYYLACCADEVVVSPSSLTGSIGVIVAHKDISKAMDQAGIKETLITAGKYKGEGSASEPLDDDARASIQSLVDTFYGMFVDTVAKARGASSSDVRAGYGQGRMLPAKAAVAAGLADRVASLDQVLSKFGALDPRKSAARALDTVVVQANAQADDDAVACTCPCEPCVGGSCADCADDECACDGCTCGNVAKAATRRRYYAARERELALLG